MLSRGVVPPDSICIGSNTSIINSPNWGMLRASVAMKIPMDVVTKRCNVATARNSASEPSSGTLSAHCTIKFSENAVARKTASPSDHNLPSMFSVGVTGMTSRCSMVPCLSLIHI